ncbi:MAG: RDD family protein [Bacteriovoracaceae bacterium]|nr:RDD family protein [Bacteriovoracaceae bacterium]
MTQSRDDENIIKIEFEKGDVDLDDINFKPVTSGLGFNSNKRTLPNTFLKHITSAEHIRTNRGPCLDIFQKSTVEEYQKEEISIERSNPESEEINISRSRQACAWAIDLLVILLFLSVTVAIFLIVPGVKVMNLLNFIDTVHMAVFATTFFLTYYVIYFTLLDFFNTPGKYVMNLQLVRTDSKTITLVHTFVRSLSSIVSFLALGAPLFMDFHGKLSDTKIAERI